MMQNPALLQFAVFSGFLVTLYALVQIIVRLCKFLFIEKKDDIDLDLEIIDNMILLDPLWEEFEIDVCHSNNQIKNSLIVLKAKLTNSGLNDIDRKSIYEFPRLIFDDSFVLKAIKVIDDIKNIGFNASIDENNLVFFWELLKPNESIEFMMLFECPAYKYPESFERLYRSFSINSRIKDLPGIYLSNNFQNIIEKRLYRGVGRISFGASMIISTILIPYIYPSIFNKTPYSKVTNRTVFELQDKTVDDNFKAILWSDSQGSIMYKKFVNEELETGTNIMQLQDFNNNHSIIRIDTLLFVKNKILYGKELINFMFGGFCILFGILSIVSWAIRIRKVT